MLFSFSDSLSMDDCVGLKLHWFILNTLSASQSPAPSVMVFAQHEKHLGYAARSTVCQIMKNTHTVDELLWILMMRWST